MDLDDESEGLKKSLILFWWITNKVLHLHPLWGVDGEESEKKFIENIENWQRKNE